MIDQDAMIPGLSNPLSHNSPKILNQNHSSNFKLVKKSNEFVRPWENSKENSPPGIRSNEKMRCSTIDVLKDSERLVDPIKALLAT